MMRIRCCVAQGPVEDHRVATEMPHTDVERCARSQRRVEKQQAYRATGQFAALKAIFERASVIENRLQLASSPIGSGDEVTHRPTRYRSYGAAKTTNDRDPT